MERDGSACVLCEPAEECAMTNAYIIEVDNEAVGIVVRSGPNYIFYASNPRYAALEGEAFPSPSQATLAARDIGKKRYVRAA